MPTDADDQQTVTVDELAGYPARVLLDHVTQRIPRQDLTVAVTREDSSSYTFDTPAGGSTWRVHGEVSDGSAGTMITDGRLLCFDRGYRPAAQHLVSMSYGSTAFDPSPWTCSPSSFGLNRAMIDSYLRNDPRARITGLEDPAPGSTGELVEVDGDRLVRFTTRGLTSDGPLSPERPEYTLWVDAEERLVRMTSAGVGWTFTYRDQLAEEVALPPQNQRGSYGYAFGPGGAAVKACIYWRKCPDPDRYRLTWGDGREKVRSR